MLTFVQVCGMVRDTWNLTCVVMFEKFLLTFAQAEAAEQVEGLSMDPALGSMQDP